MARDNFGAFSGPGAVACPKDCAPDLDLEALTKAQRAALGRIAIGWDVPQPSKRTIAALKAKGLILEFPTQYAAGIGALTMTVMRYGVPMCVHLAWALSCSEDDDGNG